MKFNLAILALVGTISAAQLQEMPKGSPDNSRSVFEAARDEATATVATQKAFEAEKTADVEARNVKDTAEADAVKQHVRAAANKNLMGRNEQNAGAQQWEGYQVGLAQVSADPKKEEAPAKEEKEVVTQPDALADAPKGDAPAPEAPKKESNKFPVGTPQHSYEAKMNARTRNAAVVEQQKKSASDFLKDHDARQAEYAAETDALKRGVKEAAAVRRQGGVTYGERALTQ